MLTKDVMAGVSDSLQIKLRQLRLLALDVDGVLSDGTLYFSSAGEEVKGFSILDGLGIKMLQKGGVEVALITGRSSPMTQRRAEDLGIAHIIQGREDKKTALEELCESLGIGLVHTAYMGDDLPDLAAIQSASVGLTVPNAYSLVKQHADYCTHAAGGRGAVREAADLILAAQGQLEGLLSAYLNKTNRLT